MPSTRYKLLKPLKDGGMGQVWHAYDTVLRREVALKSPLPQLARDPEYVERFRREAQAMARVTHDNVIDIYDVGESDDGPFIVMEYVAGGSLADVLRKRGRLGTGETMRIILQAARALDAAHRREIIHRDVKPANLLLRAPDGDHQDDRGSVVVLTDFGIAQTPTAKVLTRPDQNLGTVIYMAPELLQSGEDASPSVRSDIYSLGIVAYEGLAGRPPFLADSAVAIAMMHVTKTPPPLPQQVPAAVRQIIARATAKDPENRYPSAAALVKAIEALGRPPVPGPRAATTRVEPRPGPPVARAPIPTRVANDASGGPNFWTIALVVLALLVASGVGVGLYLHRGPDIAVPEDLREFAPNWSLERCTKDDPPGDNQDERWSCPIDEWTSIYLIRYKPGTFRDDKLTKNDEMGTTAGGVTLARGPAAAPGGRTGRYREYEVDIGTKGKPDWNDEIWFDNWPVESPPLAFLLRTKRTPNTAAAVNRIRKLWDDMKYTRPEP